jgi:hypothetical protein
MQSSQRGSTPSAVCIEYGIAGTRPSEPEKPKADEIRVEQPSGFAGAASPRSAAPGTVLTLAPERPTQQKTRDGDAAV